MRFVAVGQDKTQYLLHEIPQTINLNPAVQMECKGFIAIPVLSEIQFFYRNNGFSYRQAFLSGQEAPGDSLIFNPDRLSKVLGRRNQVRLGTGMAIFGFGFRKHDWFFSVNAANRSSFRAVFTRDLLDARDGNWDLSTNTPRPINLNGTGVHFIDYTELAFGASKKMDDGFFLGGRVKFLMGTVHLQTKRSRLNLITTPSPIELLGNSDIILRGSAPVTLMRNNFGLVTGISSPVNGIGDAMPYIFSGNLGAAIDAGVIYRYSRKLTLSASILDLGMIRWRKNINVLSQQQTFLFSGFDLINYASSGTETDLLQAIQDSLTNNFFVDSSTKPYFAFIPIRVFAGASYSINRYVDAGITGEAEILSGRVYPGLTLTAIAKPREGLTFSLSYSLMDRAFDDFGFGVSAGKGLVRYYFVTDKIPLSWVKDKNSGLLWPYSARTMNFRTGINFLICTRDRKQEYKRSGRFKYCPAYS